MNVAASRRSTENNLGRALDLLNRQRPNRARRICAAGNGVISGGRPAATPGSPFARESSEINSLAVSPDGNWLAVGTEHKGGLSVWDLRTRQELVRLAKNEVGVRAAFSPTEPLLGVQQFHRFHRGVANHLAPLEHRDATDGGRIAAG